MIKEISNILLLCDSYKNICLNVDDFINYLINSELREMCDPITDRELIKSGLYCILDKTNIWSSKIVDKKHVRVSNQKIFHATKDAEKWSCQCPLSLSDNFERVVKLKVFW